MTKYALACLVLVSCLGLSWAQTDSATSLIAGATVSNRSSGDLPVAFRFDKASSTLPSDLLHTKSVVFIDAVGSPRGNSQDWKDLAKKIHRSFDEIGIDAVAYYNWQDANAGADATRKLAKELNQRFIENIVYLAYNQESKEYTLLIAPFDTEKPFVDRQQGAFQLVAGTPKTLARQLDNVVRRSGMEKQNFLVIDVPEFFVGAGNVVRGNRMEGFAQDLKLDKLAIPSFGDERDEALKRIMMPYPYEHDFVDPERDEDDLRQDGYQFILLRLHTQEANIKNMLGYRVDPNAPPPSGSGPSIYKYYVKHIYTGDVYVGTNWDASPSWQTALTKHLRSMREAMTKKR